MDIWFLIFFVLNTNDGSIVSKVNVPNSWQYNNQQNCVESGEIILDEVSKQLTPNFLIMYSCSPVDYNSLEKALPPKS
jgi:hypothetical protein